MNSPITQFNGLARAAHRSRSPMWAVALAGLSMQCAGAQHASSTTPAQGDHAAASCVGTITAPADLHPIEDAALVASVIGAPEAGKLCSAQAFEVTHTVRVYRIWNSAQPFTIHGRWWTLERPGADREAYRTANAVCPEWSQLDRIVACDLRVGAHVALGPGQSVACQNGVSYPASSTLQLYVPNDTRATPPVLYVENCTEGDPWP